MLFLGINPKVGKPSSLLLGSSQPSFSQLNFSGKHLVIGQQSEATWRWRWLEVVPFLTQPLRNVAILLPLRVIKVLNVKGPLAPLFQRWKWRPRKENCPEQVTPLGLGCTCFLFPHITLPPGHSLELMSQAESMTAGCF